MVLNTCPFCQSDVLTIYGNEKMKCNGCGMTFLKSSDCVDSILDIWQRREGHADRNRIRVESDSGIIKPPTLVVQEAVSDQNTIPLIEKDSMMQMSTDSHSDLEDVDFGDVDDIDLF